MSRIWTMLLNVFSYFNIFNFFKNEPELVVEDKVVENKIQKSYMENYLRHNDLNVMSEWDYLVRLHIR
jgi:hypothetical protein